MWFWVKFTWAHGGGNAISPSDPSKITSAGLFLYSSEKHNRLFPTSVMTGRTTHHKNDLFNIPDRNDIRSRAHLASQWSHVLNQMSVSNGSDLQSKDLNMTLLTVSPNFPKIKQSELLFLGEAFSANADNKTTHNYTDYDFSIWCDFHWKLLACM